MAANKTPLQILFDEVIKETVTSILKPLGFRKTGMNFHRRTNDVVQVVNIQSSTSTTSVEKQFFVNVGLAFDAICPLTGQAILEAPKEYECVARGTRDRLEALVSDAPSIWTITAGEDAQAVTHHLRSAIERVAAELNRIDGIVAYRRHPWFDRFRPRCENAQIMYVLGELDAAWDEVQRLGELFADRKNANRPEWWVEELGLTKLAPRCAVQKGA